MESPPRSGDQRADARSGRWWGKADLVAALAAHFGRTAAVGDDAPDGQVKGRDWLPDAMRFGSGPEPGGPDAVLPAAAE